MSGKTDHPEINNISTFNFPLSFPKVTYFSRFYYISGFTILELAFLVHIQLLLYPFISFGSHHLFQPLQNLKNPTFQKEFFDLSNSQHFCSSNSKARVEVLVSEQYLGRRSPHSKIPVCIWCASCTEYSLKDQG